MAIKHEIRISDSDSNEEVLTTGKTEEFSIPPLDIETVIEDGVTLISLFGDLNLYNCNELRRIVLRIAESGDFRVILNFSQLTMIDSAGIGVLFILLRRAKQSPGSWFIVCNLPPIVEKIFLATKIMALFTVADTVEGAQELVRR